LFDIFGLCPGKQDIFIETIKSISSSTLNDQRCQFRFAKGMLDLFCMAFHHHSMSSTFMIIRFLSFLFLLSLSVTLGARDLPKVLLIGDSISLGYTPHVVIALKGQVEVKHHRGNAQHTGTGLKMLDRWIGETEWDVIHFNWGLWDLCYRHPQSKVQGRRDKERGTLTTSLEQYEKNLEQLAIRLKKTQAKLIWAHTTTVPKGEAGRKVGDDDKYNEAAARVMKKLGIAINDLNAFTDSFPAELFIDHGNVHFTTEGSRRLGQAVAKKILEIIVR
jgi:hypothetical protein